MLKGVRINGGLPVLKIVSNWKQFNVLRDIESTAAAKYFETGYDPSLWSTNHPEDFARYAANDLLWVALWENSPVGFAIADIFRDALHLEELDVLPEYQGRGIGTTLVNEVIAAARRRLMKTVTLRTFHTTPWSVGLYKKCGFQIIQETPYYLQLHLVNERNMGLPLDDRCTMLLSVQNMSDVSYSNPI